MADAKLMYKKRYQSWGRFPGRVLVPTSAEGYVSWYNTIAISITSKDTTFEEDL